MQPLEVVFYLSTPIALGAPWMFFDSLVAHIMLKEELGEKYYSLPTKISLDKIPEVPIKKWRDMYIASVSIFEPNDSGIHIFSFFKKGDHPFPSGKISKGSGFFKDFFLKAVYIPAVRVKFYATGELNEIKRLVNKISALGKERNIGFGFVKKVEVRELDNEWGLVKDNMAMRPIPIQYLKKYDEAVFMPYKPPYWSKKSITLCAPPFTSVEL